MNPACAKGAGPARTAHQSCALPLTSFLLHNDAVFFLTVAKMRNCEWDKMPYDSQRRADPRMSLMTHVTSTSSGSGGRQVRRNLAVDQTDRKSIIATY